MDKTYGEFQKESDMINKAFCEVMYEGDAHGRTFTFPIPTLNITRDLDWNSDVINEYMKIYPQNIKDTRYVNAFIQYISLLYCK